MLRKAPVFQRQRGTRDTIGYGGQGPVAVFRSPFCNVAELREKCAVAVGEDRGRRQRVQMRALGNAGKVESEGKNSKEASSSFLKKRTKKLLFPTLLKRSVRIRKQPRRQQQRQE